jgi:chemotaxis protein MotA
MKRLESGRLIAVQKSSKSIWVGYAIGIFCILYSIKLAGNARTFIDATSIFITVGGTLGTLVVSFPAEKLKTLGPVMKKAFHRQSFDLSKDIDTIVSLDETARKKGPLALEDTAEEYADDEFLKKGILLIVDGTDKDILRSSMEGEIYFMQKRHRQGHAMLDMIASTATSLGLLGTYVGLIPMLINLEDPTRLGPLMAVELVTSFYGAFISYILFTPMSRRLKNMSRDEVTRKELVIEGLVAIQENQNPRRIRDSLMAFLSKKEAENMRQQQNRTRARLRKVA